MSILATDLQAFLPAAVTANPATNGGRMGASAINLNAKNNVFPDVSAALRASGGVRWRKLFLANRNAENVAVQSTLVLMNAPTVYDDYAYFVPGTHEDFESGVSGDIYGCALLSQNAAAGANSVTVALEDAALAPMLTTGREILITNRTDFANTTGNVGTEEFHRIASVSVSGLIATITLEATLANAYTVAAASRICTVYRPAQLAQPQLEGWSESGSGTYDKTGFPVLLTNQGAIRQAWDIVYQSATNFTISGDTLGALGTFETSANAAPAPAGGQPYFTLKADGHGSGHAAGDRISFTTSPAAVPVWIRHSVPAGITDYGLTDIPISWQLEGES